MRNEIDEIELNAKEIKNFDFNNPDAVQELEINAYHKKQKVEEYKILQRLLLVCPDLDSALELYDLGFDSSRKITSISKSHFVKEIGAHLKGGKSAARKIYSKASGVKMQTTHIWANVNQLRNSPHYMSLNAAPAPQVPTETFENISSYQEIFGSLNYCDCPECKSILGPAAYLVDLLRIIDKAITKPNQANIPSGLRFDDRRPDIGKISLTCANTNDLVPYLQIVNNTLQLALQHLIPANDVFEALTTQLYPFNLPFNYPLQQIRAYLEENNTSLSDVFQVMDKTADVLSDSAAREYLKISYEEYANLIAQNSADLPAILTANYGLPISNSDISELNHVDVFTSQVGINYETLSDLLIQNLSVEEIFNVTGNYTTSAKGSEIILIQKGNSVTGSYNSDSGIIDGTLINDTVRGSWKDSTGASGYFEFVFDVASSYFKGKWNTGYGLPWEAKAWDGTRNTGANDFPAINGLIPHNLFINKSFTNDDEYLKIVKNATDPANEYDEIVNLDLGSLDTVNRFVRLADKIGYSYEDLDWMLRSVSSLLDPVTREINSDVFVELAKIEELESVYSIPRYLLPTLWYDIKTTGIGSGQYSEAPFDQIFNSPELVASANGEFYRPKYPSNYPRFSNPLYQTKPEFWNFTKAKPNNVVTVADILVSGIPCSSDDIRLIAEASLDVSAPIELSVSNLSVLYRHCMLAKVMNIQVQEYILLLKLLGMTKPKNSNLIVSSLTPDQLLKIMKTRSWSSKLGLSAFAIDFICNGNTSEFVSSGYDEDNIPSFIESFNLAFKNSLLSKDSFTGNGLDKSDSTAIFVYLSTNKYISDFGLVLESKPLTQANMPDTIPQLPGLTFTETQKVYIVSTVNKFKKDQKSSFATNLSSFFGVKANSIQPVFDQLQLLLTDPDFLEKFIKPNVDNDFVRNFIALSSRFYLLYKSLNFNTIQVEAILNHADAFNQVFDVNVPKTKIEFKIENIELLNQFKTYEQQFDDQKNLLAIYFSKVGTSGYDAQKKLSAITGWHDDQITMLWEYFFGVGKKCKTLKQFSQMEKVMSITNDLGSDVYFLQQLNTISTWTSAVDNWDDFNKYASTLLQNVKANTSTEAWPDIYKKVNGNLEEAKRNAMLDLTVWEVGKIYSDITNANDLYEFLLLDVKRSGCQEISLIKEALNASQLYLQRCRLNLERNVEISPDDIPKVYWEWIMNYRIWEANREVFLYPENYIDPSLRKSKTDLFSKLENDLSQGNVNKETVKASYTNYLDSLSELATLRYVDAYHCTVESEETGATDTLFLFAKTQSKPNKFYYISRDDADVWSQWNEINITINSDTVTPIYAFSKLFIFWVELSTSNEKALDSDAKKSIVTKASIKYSFYNFSGDWEQPQTLASDIIIKIDDPNSSLYGPFDKTTFDLSNLFWNKVAVMDISADNYPSSDNENQITDKMAILYGPLVQGAVASSPAPSTQGGPDFQAFVETVTDGMAEAKILKDAKDEGVPFPLNQAIILNSEMESSGLIYNSKRVILTNNTESLNCSYPSFYSKIGQYGKNLAIASENNSLLNNYLEAMGGAGITIQNPSPATANVFVNTSLGIDAAESAGILGILKGPAINMIDSNDHVLPSAIKSTTSLITGVCQLKNELQGKFVRDTLFQLYYGTPILFGNVTDKNSKVIPVKNQPGWLLFQTGSECFLFEAFKQKTDTTKEFTATFDKIYEGNKLSSPFGYATKTTFEDAGFDSALVNKFYPILQSPAVSMIDSNGVVNISLVEAISASNLEKALQGDVNEIEAGEIREVMLQSTRVGMNYSSKNFDLDDNIHNIQFKTTRLTTSAIKTLSRKLFLNGIDDLLSLESQQPPRNVSLPFDNYLPGRQVTPPDVSSGDQVSFKGPYGNYYAELFFHGPFLVSKILNNNQQFEAAEGWLQYVFNPTLNAVKVDEEDFITNDIDSGLASSIFTMITSPALGLVKDGEVTNIILTLTPDQLTQSLQGVNNYQGQEVYNILINNYLQDPLSRYWQYLPFRNNKLQPLVDQLTDSDQIKVYDTDPFDPHAIAQLRLGAYEKTVVMHYIQNLVDWGDSEFRKYTWESLTAALMLYVYASDLLGPKPEDLGPCPSSYPVNFDEILKKYSKVEGGIPQFLIDMENAISVSGKSIPQTKEKDVPFNDIEAYFCVPENDTFISKWAVVENRLYNIRHCLNIDGIAEPLPLFQPPIDPMALVKAAASGNNVLDVASLTQPNVPAYRFSFMIEQAKMLTSTLNQLGGNLLAALEKNDAQGMALLQSSNELNILNLTTIVKEKQIEQLQDQLKGLEQNYESAKAKESYYENLLSVGLNAFEILDLGLRTDALVPHEISMGINGISIAGYLAPNIFGFSDGGMKFGDAINAGAQISSITAEILNQTAGIVSTAGNYERRQEDWTFQKEMAAYEVQQLQNQIDASNVGILIAQQELLIQKKTTSQTQNVDDYLKSKFTNQDLYQWMISRLSSLYFQTYSLAQSMALKAQAAFQFELDSEEQYLTFNYWDDLRKGLLSGESLMMSLQQMDSAYIQNNTRRLEVEKSVSLLNEFPADFLKFKWGQNGGTKGKFDFTLSEKLFDFDFPNHYCRKIKSISISIPAIVGPYQSINAELVQNTNMVVLDHESTDAVSYAIAKTVPDAGPIPKEPAGDKLRQNWVPSQAIALSKGVDDSGLFMLDFKDERYLPFEGTGAVSTWTLNMPPSTNKINYDSISDVIVNIKYTAKDGGETFGNNVKALYPKLPKGAGNYLKAKTFDLKQAFASNWFKLFSTPPVSSKQSITFKLTDDNWLTALSNVTVEKISVQLEIAQNGSMTNSTCLNLVVGTNSKAFDLTNNFGTIEASDLNKLGFGVDSADCTLEFDLTSPPPEITKTEGGVAMLDDTKLLDMAVLIIYSEKSFLAH